MLDIDKAEALHKIGKQLERIANILEVVFAPQLQHERSTTKVNEEKDSWKGQATYYMQACQRKNKEIDELRDEIKELKSE